MAVASPNRKKNPSKIKLNFISAYHSLIGTKKAVRIARDSHPEAVAVEGNQV